MHPNEKLIEKFYACFQKRDYVGMAACYHDEVEFSDMVFKGILLGWLPAVQAAIRKEAGKNLEMFVRKTSQRGQATTKHATTKQEKA